MKMWFKSLLVAAPAGLFIALPAPAQAAGPCADLEARSIPGYMVCIGNAQAQCTAVRTGFNSEHAVCTYPSGGRDECDDWTIPFTGSRNGTCTYFAPGA